MIEEVSSDVLIIGGGNAAVMAAMEPPKYGLKTVLVDKGKLGRSGSSVTSGCGAHMFIPPDLGGDPQDSEELYVKDAVKGGEFLNAQNMTEIYASEAIDRILELEKNGISFEKTSDGKFLCSRALGETYPRGGLPIGKGLAFMEVLRREILHRGVDVFENVMITKLLTQNGRVAGALGLHKTRGFYFIFKANSIVLAAGSATGLYPYRSPSFITTGDAYAMLYDAGAQLMNMEFQEFTAIPVIKGTPYSVGGLKIWTSSGARFYNNLEERFMKKYDPERMELTTRGKLVQAMSREIRAGHGPIMVDATKVTIPNCLSRKILVSAGIDYKKERIEWMPAIHTSLGGVIINEKCETAILGLYAAGESAGHGAIFGADRVGGANGACYVLGQKAGKFAAEFALKVKKSAVNTKQVEEEIIRIEMLPNKYDPNDLDKVRSIAWQCIGVIRNEEDLKKGVKEFVAMRKKGNNGSLASNSKGITQALEIWTLALTGELISRAAMMRIESRGQHQREDYPLRDDRKWLKWIIITKVGEEMGLSTRPVPIESYRIKPC